jgi:hypothetical protein
MQRVMHSILTARILLNLRQAITLDRGTRAGTLEDNETSFHVNSTALSSVVIGVNTWFREDNGINTQTPTTVLP